jgi:hypothetical protein
MQVENAKILNFLFSMWIVQLSWVNYSIKEIVLSGIKNPYRRPLDIERKKTQLMR